MSAGGKDTPLPPLGLIEGFFGPPWEDQERLAMARFLQQNGFDFYFYAPKADPHLRKKWREAWSPEYRQKLAALSRHFRSHGVKFGVGLSPFELHHLSRKDASAALAEKLSFLEEAGIDWLGLFFDDFPVHEGLAEKQLEAIEIVQQHTRARIIFCPSFYSPDPILEKVFGKRPERYFEEIKNAPAEIEFAWTGPKVISEDIPPAHLKEAEALLGRKPFLWDNLFANDGPRNCKFLKIRPPVSRTVEALGLSSGWAWNPMNQAALSRLVLLGTKLSVVDGKDPGPALEEAIRSFCPAGLAEFVSRNREGLLTLGLDKLEPATKEAWRAELSAWDHPVAREIRDWLEGKFVVGAECLTD